MRGKVLVVDDDAIALGVVRGRLEEAGFNVVAQNTPMGTGAAVLREKPDVVLLDVEMPGLTGDAIAQLLRRSEAMKGVPVILYSGLDLSTLQELARECGAVGALQKTRDPRAFMAQFERLVERITRGKGRPS